MSEPMSSVEIEDVLSSIRRLVSEDLRPQTRAAAGQAGQPVETGDKLILTPALRIVADEPQEPAAVSPDDQEAGFWENAPPEAPASAEVHDFSAEPETGGPETGGSEPVEDAAGSATVEHVLASLQAAPHGDDWEPEAEQLDMAAIHWADGAWPDARPEGIDMDEVEEAEVVAAAAPPALDEGGLTAWGSDVWEDTIEAALAAAPATDEPAAQTPDQTPTQTPEQAEAEAIADILAGEAAFDDEDPAAVIEAAAMAALAARKAEAGPQIGLFDEENPGFDEEALRELVRDIIREELQGSLGERITRNVRKLVRVEINRALAAQDFD
jgi:hypothetical protein